MRRALSTAGRALDVRLASGARERALFLLGGPGSGKGTQGARLTARLGLVHLSVGDLLRREIREAIRGGAAADRELTREVQSSLARGAILPGWVTASLIARECGSEAMREERERVRGASPLAGTLLIDGFPRSLDNVREFEDRVGLPMGMLYVRCSHAEMMSRVMLRAETSGRPDDTAEVLERRLKTFEEETVPVIELFRERGLLLEIDGHGDEDEVFERAHAALGPLLRKAAARAGGGHEGARV